MVMGWFVTAVRGRGRTAPGPSPPLARQTVIGWLVCCTQRRIAVWMDGWMDGWMLYGAGTF